MAKPGNTNLTWRQAWFELLNGKKIKLPSWEGYWKWENNTIMMHCSNGEIIDIRNTENPAYTFTNIASNEWMILDDNYDFPKLVNCSIEYSSYINSNETECVTDDITDLLNKFKKDLDKLVKRKKLYKYKYKYNCYNDEKYKKINKNDTCDDYIGE